MTAKPNKSSDNRALALVAVQLLYVGAPACFPGFAGHVYTVTVSPQDTNADVLSELLICIHSEEIFDASCDPLPHYVYDEIADAAQELFSHVNPGTSFCATHESGGAETLAYFGVCL